MSELTRRAAPPVAYEVELDVDPWGVVEGSEDLLPVPAGHHDWFTAYPPLPVELVLRWARGNRHLRPNVYWYPQISGWVCDKRAFDVLNSVVPQDIHVIGRARLDEQPAWLVQVVSRLHGIVDDAASLYERYPSYAVMEWPSFRRSAAESISNRLFGLPDMYLAVFMGAQVKAAFDEAGIVGLRFVPVDWTDDRDWIAQPRADEQAAWQLATELCGEPSWPRGVPVGLAHVATLLRLDQAMHEQGLLAAVAGLDAGQVEAASVAAEYLGLPALAEAIRATLQWTKSTAGELEARYHTAAADNAIRDAFAERFRRHGNEFR